MQESGQIIIPVWGLITLLTPFVLAGLWALVNMFFFNKASKERMDLFDTRMINLEARHDKSDQDFNDKIIKVRADFEKEFEKMDNSIGKILEKQVETQTLVKLLVDNKIKS